MNYDRASLNSVFHVVEDPDGSFHGNAHFNFANVKGIGQETGVTYRVPTTINSTSQVTLAGQLIATETTMSLTVGQGQAPDQQATAVLHIVVDEDGTVTVEVAEFRFECRS